MIYTFHKHIDQNSELLNPIRYGLSQTANDSGGGGGGFKNIKDNSHMSLHTLVFKYFAIIDLC